MELIDAIEKRWSCRKYSDKNVEKEIVAMILDAARFAPSAGNLQDRSFIVIRSDETKQEIAKACGNQSWMTTAPVHIVVVSETKQLSSFFKERGEKIYAIQDTAFAVQNMLLAATSLNMGSSLVVGFDENKISELLKIHTPAKPYAIITLGYPLEQAKAASKFDLEKFVYFEKYGEKVENSALALGECSEVRKQITNKAGKEIKKTSKNIFDKIKSIFKKKKEEPKIDHFMEEIKTENKTTEIKKTEDEEIPRQLPKVKKEIPELKKYYKI